MQIKLVAKTKRNTVITLGGKLTDIDTAYMLWPARYGRNESRYRALVHASVFRETFFCTEVHFNENN